MLYLALSCLQGRSAREAVEELLELEPDGIQLTPGNYPERGFKQWFLSLEIPYRLHHGFDWGYRRRRVWDGLRCDALPGATVHPPRQGPYALSELFEASRAQNLVLETMYPGYYLGEWWELEAAMDEEMPLAVDVSHIALQERDTPSILERVSSYPHIEEIHVSQQHKGKDAHRPITPHTRGVKWAKEHDAPLILECYMHRLSKAERRQQLEILRE